MRKSLLIPTVITFLLLSVTGVVSAVDNEPPPAGTNCTVGTEGYEFVERYNPFSSAWLNGHVHGGPPSPRPYHRRDVNPGGAMLRLTLRQDHEILRFIIEWESNTSFPSSVDLEATGYSSIDVLTGGVRMYTPAEPIEAGVLQIIGYDSGNTNTSLSIISVWACYGEEVEEYEPPGEDEWIRPLQSQDEDVFYTPIHKHTAQLEIEIGYASSVNVVSSSGGAPVLAATAGTVIDVRSSTENNCSIVIVACYILLNDPLSGDTGRVVYAIEHVGDLYDVVIQVDTEILIYTVAKAPDYVKIGDVISAGCILGETVEIRRPIDIDQLAVVVGIIELVLPIEEDRPGYAQVALFDTDLEPVEIIDRLVAYGFAIDACNKNALYSECLNADPQFYNERNWEILGAGVWEQGRITLLANATVQQGLNLSPDEFYGVVARVSFVGAGTRTAQVKLGNGVETVSYTSEAGTAIQLLFLPSGQHTPDFGATFWRMSITNTGTATMIVHSVCVTSAAPNTAPSSCFFPNPGFDNGLDPWTTNTAQTFAEFPGEIFMFDGDIISYGSMTLYPLVESEEFEYSITVNARVIATSDWDGSLGETQIFWRFPSDEDTPQLLGEVDSESFFADVDGNADRDYLYTFSDIIAIDTETSGSFQLSVEADTMEDDLLGFRVDSVCLSTADGTFPGYTGAGETIDFVARCQTVPRPVSYDIGPWIRYLWHNLDRFFQCDLMVLLHQMHQTIMNFYQMVGWSIRYSMAVGHEVADWSGEQLFPWLAGNFNNMTGQQITVSEGGGIGLLDVVIAIINALRDVLLAIIDALSQFLNETLLAIALRVIDLLFFLIGQIFGLFQQGLDFLLTIYESWNSAEPAEIPGLPNCQTEPETKAWCITLWVLENTVFSPGPGTALMIIIMATGFANIAIWVIGKAHRMIMQVGGVT